MKSGKQLHWPLSPFSMQCEFGPHGDGRQGFTLTGGDAATMENDIYLVVCAEQRSWKLYVKGQYLRINWQVVNGSPEYPDKHVQTGLWLTTMHWAFRPQAPGHGSIHFWFEQALFRLQSELTVHSGRQLGGLPIKPCTQTHTACPFNSLHWLYGPHGDGIHKLIGSGGDSVNNTHKIIERLNTQHKKRKNKKVICRQINKIINKFFSSYLKLLYNKGKVTPCILVGKNTLVYDW